MVDKNNKMTELSLANHKRAEFNRGTHVVGRLDRRALAQLGRDWDWGAGSKQGRALWSMGLAGPRA
jgi:hypothetical protein